MRAQPARQAQGLWVGHRELEQAPPAQVPHRLTCDAVYQHLPLMQLLFQLSNLSLLAPVGHRQLWGEAGW